MIATSNNKNHELLVLAILLLIFSISSLSFLDLFPKVWMDEAWDSTTAYTFQMNRTLRNLALISPAYGNQNVHFLQPRILSSVITAPLFAVLGVGSIPGRLASVWMGGLAILGMYLLARKVGNHIFAFICALFLIFDNLFFVITRTIRPEIYVITITIWAMLLILDERISCRKFFFAGVLLGVSLYTHPNSALVVIAIFIIVLAQVGIKQYGSALLPLILGIGLGILPYAYYVWYQDGANQFHDFWLQIQHRAEVLKNPATVFSGAIIAELERYRSYIFFPYRLLIFLVQIASIVYALYNNRDQFNKSFLIFIFVHVALFPILISAKTSRYLAVLMPIMVILVMRMVWDLAGWSYYVALPVILSSITKLNRRTLFSTGLVLILFINQAGGDAWAVWKSRDCAFSPFISQVRLLVPPGVKVWGPMTFWFGFFDYQYRTQWTINTADEMSNFQPDYLILYDNTEIWANRTGVTGRLDPNYERMEAIRNLAIQLAKDRGASVGSVPNRCYGNIEVFQLTWD